MSQSTTQVPEEPTWEECMELIHGLPGMSLEEKKAAIETMIRNPSPGIRQRALSVGAAVIPEDLLVAYLREEGDDVLRNAGLEMLKLRGAQAFGLAVHLLSDGDPDVILQAVAVLDHLRDPRALEPLRAILRHGDPNLLHHTLVAIGRLGDARALTDILPFLKADPWLQMAAVNALGDLRCSAAITKLRGLLSDPFLGPMASEAIARIGGARAFQALSAYWLAIEDTPEGDGMVGLLLHVIEGLPKAPMEPPHLRFALAQRLSSPDEALRAAAAASLLGLGPGSEDDLALKILAARPVATSEPPACLTRRGDLIARLLRSPDLRAAWGLGLAARYPHSPVTDDLRAALSSEAALFHPEMVVQTLQRTRRPELAPDILSLYLQLGQAGRKLLHPLFISYRKPLHQALRFRADLDIEDKLALSARVANKPGETLRQIALLPPEPRARVLDQILDCKGFVQHTLWQSWVQEDPGRFLPLATEAAVSGQTDLMPLLRQCLGREPRAELIRCAGRLKDSVSVPLLAVHLEEAAPLVRALIVESLGEIGGSEARSLLKAEIVRGPASQTRGAYRALSLCATDEESDLFRACLTHADWAIRLAAVEALARLTGPDNLGAVAALAGDPMPVVAQRVRAVLESA